MRGAADLGEHRPQDSATAATHLDDSMAEHVADQQIPAPGGDGSIGLHPLGDNLPFSVGRHANGSTLADIGRPILAEVHVGEIEIPFQPGGALGEDESLGQLDGLDPRVDDIMVESVLLFRVGNVVGPDRPEDVQRIGSKLAHVARVDHPARQQVRVLLVTVYGVAGIQDSLLQRTAQGDHQLILGMDVEREVGIGVHANPAQHGVLPPDQTGEGSAALIGLVLDRGRQGRPLDLVQIVDLVGLDGGSHALVGEGDPRVLGMGLSGQAQMVQPNRREDLDGLEPLAARLQGTLAAGRQVEHAVLAQLEGLLPDHAGRGALLHQRDQLFSQRLLGVAAARLHAEELHQGSLSPGDGGLDAFGDLDHRKLRRRNGLARLQAGRDLGMGDIPGPPSILCSSMTSWLRARHPFPAVQPARTEIRTPQTSRTNNGESRCTRVIVETPSLV